MKPVLPASVLVSVVVLGAVFAPDASADTACTDSNALTPRSGASVPPNPQVIVFGTDEPATDYIARINGKEVSLDTEDFNAGAFYIKLLKIHSDTAGKLKIYQLYPSGGREDAEEQWIASYTVKKKLKVASKVVAKATPLLRDPSSSTGSETYDALAIDLGAEKLAIKATVKLRRDAKSEWQTLELPVVQGDFVDKRTTVRVGQLGCAANYPAALLHAGVELEASLLMVDGSEVSLSLPASYRLPAPPAKPATP